jgi:hypothetical protein
MRLRVRENAVLTSVAVAGCAAMAWLGLYSYQWTDYEDEVKPAFDALVRGHLLEFLRLAPAYGGSLVERAPFALLPGLWGGGPLAVFRSVAVPCLVAAGALALLLAGRMRARGASGFACMAVVVICTANPLTLSALEFGHPEELLGGCLCVAAVLACRPSSGLRRCVLAGALLGLAIANKEWALVACGPVALALLSSKTSSGRSYGWLLALTVAGVLAALVLAPLLLVSGGSFTASAHAAASSPATLFKPWQLWWFFGRHGALAGVRSGAAQHGARLAPTWASTISHPAVVLAGLGLAGAVWLKRRHSARALDQRDALLLLALVLLVRCMLDTWDIGYYMLPCLLALLAWESYRETPRPPLLTLGAIVLPWLALQQISERGASPDQQSLFFTVWTLALAGWLGWLLFSGRAAQSAQLTTVSSRGRPVSTSQPLSVTATSSSMRTPSSPGRYTPGSTLTTLPASNGSSSGAARDSRGASWISKPTP